MKGSGLIVLVLAGCGLILATTAEAAPGFEYGLNNQRDFRSRRGFKQVGLQTARGFGKRTILPAFSGFSSPSSYDQQQTDEHPGNDDPETYARLIHFSAGLDTSPATLSLYTLTPLKNHLFLKLLQSFLGNLF